MEKSMDYFDKIATEWDNMRSEFFSEQVRNVAYELAEVEEGFTAADIGAGTGFVSEGLLERGLKVIAVDQSEKMLIFLRNKFSSYTNLQCVQGDGEHLPLEDNQVDYVFANMFLHHVESPILAIKEMVRILKSGGKLVITDLDEHNFEFLRTEQFDVWLGFDRDQIKQWFEEVGLSKVTIDSVGSNCCADSSCGCQAATVSIFAAYGEKLNSYKKS